MKKIFIAMLIASAFFSLSASAQNDKNKSGFTKQMLIDSLKISDQTADSIMAVRHETLSQMKTIMSDESLSQEDKRAKVKPLKQEMQTKLKKFLSDDQIAKLQQMEMDRRQGRKSK